MASRAQVAEVLAATLADGGSHESRAAAVKRAAAVRQAAAWLVSTGRGRQADYLARDVAAVLERRGYALVRVVTARELEAGSRHKIEAYVKELTGVEKLELVTAVDPSLVGGVVIETPSARLDASVKQKLQKFVEGVIK
jgi:F0F1-type ATP synthase delta subunit